MARDSHKQQVYDWEIDAADELSDITLSLEQAQDLSERACALFDLPPVPINLGRSDLRNGSYYSHSKRAVVLAPGRGLNKLTVLHEIAHYVDRMKNGNGAPSHNPDFVWVYCDLLIHFGHYNRSELYTAANRHGIYVQGQTPDYVLADGEVRQYPF